jgi:hypothetical protein
MAIKEIIICGQTVDGRKFRPSDWAERLYYAVASYGSNQKVNFNPLVNIRIKDEMKCVAVDQRLQDEDTTMFEFLIGFGRDNELMMMDQDGRRVIDV